MCGLLYINVDQTKHFTGYLNSDYCKKRWKKTLQKDIAKTHSEQKHSKKQRNSTQRKQSKPHIKKTNHKIQEPQQQSHHVFALCYPHVP